jgi:RimJ/RimL family protein N-acetyltransferase
VIEKASGAMVGDVVLQPAPFAPGEVEPEYHFARRGQHRGSATEVARALVEHAFAVSSLRRLVAAIALGNVSSLKLAARLGMRKVDEVMHASAARITSSLSSGATAPTSTKQSTTAASCTILISDNYFCRSATIRIAG